MKSWTDKLILKFARVTTQGSHGKYAGCKTSKKKLERFKELHRKKKK